MNSKPFAMYQRFSRMKPMSRSDRTKKIPMTKKIAIQTAVTLRRNGTLALASAIASVLPAAAFPSTSSTTPATDNATAR